MSRDFKELVLNTYISQSNNYLYFRNLGSEDTYEDFIATSCINFFNTYFENGLDKDAFTVVSNKKELANAIFNEWRKENSYKINIVCLFKSRRQKDRVSELSDQWIEIGLYKEVLIRYLRLQINIMKNKVEKLILDET